MTNMFVMGLEGDDITPGLVGAKLLLCRSRTTIISRLPRNGTTNYGS